MNKIKGWLTNNFLNFAGKKILPGVFVAFLTLLTVGTSLAGVGKVVGTFTSEKHQQSGISQGEVKGASTDDLATDSGITDGSIDQSGSTEVSGSQNNNGILQSNNLALAQTATPVPTIATSSSSSSNSSSCIITLFGQQYNITNLLSTHSGGNVFSCGNDMSSSYQNRHGTNVNMMQPYLIGGNSNSGATPTSTPTPTQAPSNNGNGSPTPTQAPTPTPTSGGSCTVTIFGKQYNITSLLTSHSGGNVFSCGTDMSTVYQGRHGTNVSMMQPYLIASGATPTPTPTRIPTPTPTRIPTSTPTPTRTPTPTPTRTPTPTPRTPTPTPTRTPSGAPTPTRIPTPTPTRIPTSTPTPTRTPTPTPTRVPTPTPTSVPTPTLTPTPASGCIVTIFGKRYEITSLLRSHSGGNVFTCGADMSSAYQSRHGTSVSMMQRYLIP